MNKHSYLSTRLVDLNNIKCNVILLINNIKQTSHRSKCIAFKKKLLTLQQRGIWTCVSPPGPHHPNSFCSCSERVANPGFRRGRRRSNKERQRLQPLASVARAPLFEVREWGLHTALTGIHPLHVHELYYLIGVILMFCFLTWNITLETLMLIYLHSSISVGLNRSPFTADLVHERQFWPKYYFQLQ